MHHKMPLLKKKNKSKKGPTQEAVEEEGRQKHTSTLPVCVAPIYGVIIIDTLKIKYYQESFSFHM